MVGIQLIWFPSAMEFPGAAALRHLPALPTIRKMGTLLPRSSDGTEKLNQAVGINLPGMFVPGPSGFVLTL